jgi:Zn-dependent M16 (insulinase) family peptidase
VSANAITTIGKPSAALAAKLDKDEKERIAKRKEEFGEEKLAELERKMQKAKEESDVAPPPEMIGDFPITDVSRAPSDVRPVCH